MRNKLTRSARNGISFLVLTCLFLAQSCRKDILSPSKGPNHFTVAEARTYFDANIKGTAKPRRLMAIQGSGGTISEPTLEDVLNGKQALWNSAYETMISTGKAVKVPLDFGRVYAVVSPGTKKVVPFGSLNYLLMYKDSLQAVHAEWVLLLPDSAWFYGNRAKYTGNILVKGWSGRTIKSLSYAAQVSAGLVSKIGVKKLSSLASPPPPVMTGGGGPVVPVCIDVTYTVTPNCTCSAEHLAKFGCDRCPVCTGERTKTFCTWPFPDYDGNTVPTPGGNGGGASPTPGNGGIPGYGTSPEDYTPPPCDPDPNYVLVVNPDGSMNPQSCVPIPQDPPPPEPPVMNNVEFLSAVLPFLTLDEIAFLESNELATGSLVKYLQVNGGTQENLDFIDWAIGYLTANPSADKATFIKNFFTEIENKDSDTDDNTWYQNTTQQQQQLPSKLDYYNNYPKRVENGYIYGLKSAEVYTFVGGSLDTKNKAGNPDYQNACAIRGSRALNYAGITIPVVVYNNKKKTEQGADGKNYILAATAFQRFMNETFGNATYKLTSQQIGNDKGKIVDFLKAKTGIFVVTNMYPGTAGYSGHVDYIINGACINGANINPKGGIEKIEIWELN